MMRALVLQQSFFYYSLLFVILLLHHLSSTAAVAASPPINLTVKSSFLKDLLSQGESTTPTKKISMDLSGRYDCQVTGTTDALVVTTRQPFLRVGAIYDLLSSGKGNSIFTKLQWNKQGVDWQIALERPSIVSTCVKLSSPTNQACCLELGIKSNRQAHLIGRIITAGRRLTMEYNANLLSNGNDEAVPSVPLSSQQQTNDPDWWIPNMSISTGGRLESTNILRLPKRTSIRLRWSRSLGWFGSDNEETSVKLEVMQRHSPNHDTTATIQGILEDLRATTHLTLAHQHRHHHHYQHTTTTTMKK